MEQKEKRYRLLLLILILITVVSMGVTVWALFFRGPVQNLRPIMLRPRWSKTPNPCPIKTLPSWNRPAAELSGWNMSRR